MCIKRLWARWMPRELREWLFGLPAFCQGTACEGIVILLSRYCMVPSCVLEYSCGIISDVTWVFFDFVSDSGENLIHQWIEDLPASARKQVKAKLNTRITYLEAVPTFGGGYVEMLHGECAGLFEIRLEVKNVQYRPLACYGPSQGEVTLLFMAREIGGRFEPPSACRTAQQRRSLTMQDRRYICPHDSS